LKKNFRKENNCPIGKNSPNLVTLNCQGPDSRKRKHTVFCAISPLEVLFDDVLEGFGVVDVALLQQAQAARAW
jgi:hypothetical protein